jgi:hypothetical protein
MKINIIKIAIENAIIVVEAMNIENPKLILQRKIASIKGKAIKVNNLQNFKMFTASSKIN